MTRKCAINPGDRYGRLEILQEAPSHITAGKQRIRCWDVVCDCGVTVTVRQPDIRSGKTKSCGCLSREAAALANKTHGMTGTRTHEIWRGMIKRCTQKNRKDYKYYGGRGISVCARWLTFDAFFADMGEAPAGMSIERKNNDGNYEPSNCCWATQSQQVKNKRMLRDTASGVRGVTRIARNGKWRATAYHNGRKHGAGVYSTIAAAEQAVKNKLVELERAAIWS